MWKLRAFATRSWKQGCSAPHSDATRHNRRVMENFRSVLLGIGALLITAGSVLADETVKIGGSRAILITPAAPKASVILMPGGNGAIHAGDHGDIYALKGNQLVR